MIGNIAGFVIMAAFIGFIAWKIVKSEKAKKAKKEDS